MRSEREVIYFASTMNCIQIASLHAYIYIYEYLRMSLQFKFKCNTIRAMYGFI